MLARYLKSIGKGGDRPDYNPELRARKKAMAARENQYKDDLNKMHERIENRGMMLDRVSGDIKKKERLAKMEKQQKVYDIMKKQRMRDIDKQFTKEEWDLIQDAEYLRKTKGIFKPNNNNKSLDRSQSRDNRFGYDSGSYAKLVE